MTRFSLFFLFFFLSCNSLFDPLDKDVWILISTYGYKTQTEQDAAELPYTETVEFVSEGLFPKSRFTQTESEVAAGRWSATNWDARQLMRSLPIIIIF